MGVGQWQSVEIWFLGLTLYNVEKNDFSSFFGDTLMPIIVLWKYHVLLLPSTYVDEFWYTIRSIN